MKFPIIKVPITKSQLRIAIIQLRGPLPDGKTIGVLHDRETFIWTSLECMHQRLNKATYLLDQIARLPTKTDIIIFPEYALPLEASMEVMHAYANEHKCIIVLGSDNVLTFSDKTTTVLTKGAVFIPDQPKPVFITKRHLSKWEHGWIDEPTDPELPVFEWNVGEKTYRFVVHLCSDFLMAIDEHLPASDAALLRFVPMCSPEGRDFHVYADVILGKHKSHPNGVAVVLINCAGESTDDSSAVYALTPLGARLTPAFQLPATVQCMALFTVDCDALVPPRRAGDKTKGCLSSIQAFEVLDAEKPGIVPLPLVKDTERLRQRGVINPAIFRARGKRLRIAFLDIESYSLLAQIALKEAKFECYAILGHKDLLITHLGDSLQEMLFDVSHIIAAPHFDGTADDETFPCFEVIRFHKVLGVPVTEADRRACASLAPTDEEMDLILQLGKDWDCETVSHELREQLKKRRWLLGPTQLFPGAINAIMAIGLHAYGDMARAMQTFEDYVLPTLVEDQAITSVFEGDGHRMQFQYVIRVSCKPENLFSLIENVHESAKRARLIISTHTFVIIRKWSDLGLDSLRSYELKGTDSSFRTTHILPHLDEEEKQRFIALSMDGQQVVIEHIRRVHSVLRRITSELWLPAADLQRIENEIARGLSAGQFSRLADPHNTIQGRVEEVVRRICQPIVTDDYLDTIRDDLGIVKGKKTEGLTYAEWLKVASLCAKRGFIATELSDEMTKLFERTRDIRNAITHRKWNEVTAEGFVAAMVTYCDFLRRYDR